MDRRLSKPEVAKTLMLLLVFVWIAFTIVLLIYLRSKNLSLWWVTLPSLYLLIPLGINFYQGYLSEDLEKGSIEWYLSPLFYMPFICLLALWFYIVKDEVGCQNLNHKDTQKVCVSTKDVV